MVSSETIGVRPGVAACSRAGVSALARLPMTKLRLPGTAIPAPVAETAIVLAVAVIVVRLLV